MWFYAFKGALYREARTIHDLTPEYLEDMQANDWVRVFHATHIDSHDTQGPQNMVFGIDALGQQQKSSYHPNTPGGYSYRGLYVGPTKQSVGQFGSLVFEFAVKARNLHATDWSANIERQWEKGEAGAWHGDDLRWLKQKCTDQYPYSFNPLLSGALDPSARADSCGSLIRALEPQALLVGIVPARDILAVHYIDKTYTPEEFIQKYQKDLAWSERKNPDPKSTRLTWDDYVDIALDRYDRHDIKSFVDVLFRYYAMEGEQRVLYMLKQMAPLSDASARKFWGMIQQRYCDQMVATWEHIREKRPDLELGEAPRCSQQRAAAYRRAPSSLKMITRKAREAKQFLLDLNEELGGDVAARLEECCLWQLQQVHTSLHYLAKAWNESLLDPDEATRWSDLINIYSLYGQFAELSERLEQSWQKLVDTAEQERGADLQYARWGDMADSYDYGHGEGAFVAEAAPLLEQIARIPSALEAYAKLIDALEAEQEWRQHKIQQYREHKEGNDVLPPSADDTEIVFHATTAYNEILRDGFKLRSQMESSGGLGGSASLSDWQQEGISFTGNEEIAQGILEAYWDLAEVLQGPRDREALMAFANRLRVPEEVVKKHISYLYNMPDDEQLEPYSAFNIFRNIIGQASVTGHYYDPLFIAEKGMLETFMKLKPNDAGVIEATIDTTNPAVGYYRSMDEWRVPLDAILGYGPVGSQQGGQQISLDPEQPDRERHAATPEQDREFRRIAEKAYHDFVAFLRAHPTEEFLSNILKLAKSSDGWFAYGVDFIDVDPTFDHLRIFLRADDQGGTRGSHDYDYFSDFSTIYLATVPCEDLMVEKSWGKEKMLPGDQFALMRDNVPKHEFVHEFVHYLDARRRDKPAKPKVVDYYEQLQEEKRQKQLTPEERRREYLSTPAEFNAWYQANVRDLEHHLDELEKYFPDEASDYLSTEQRFITKTIEFFGSRRHIPGRPKGVTRWSVSDLDQKYHRKLLKRLHGLYMNYVQSAAGTEHPAPELERHASNDSYVGVYHGQLFWSGAVDLRDGEIIEVHSYKQAEAADFHHSHYFSIQAQQLMRDEEAAFFWVDRRTGSIEVHYDVIPRPIIGRIKQQIEIKRTTVAGLRTAAKITVYHGTATGQNDQLLKRVLKEGLIPNPKDRVWGERLRRDPGDYSYWQDREKESLEGVYFTTVPRTTNVYMNTAQRTIGGDGMVIIAQIETRTPTVTLDEETLFGYRRLAVGQYIAHQSQGKLIPADGASLPRYLLHGKIDWRDVARWFIETELINGVLQGWEIPEQRIKAILPLMAAALRWQAEYFMAEYHRDKKGWSYREYDQYGRKSPEDALRNYRSYTEAVLQKFRELADVPARNESFSGHNIRVLEPVTYRGANRILAVLRVQEIRRDYNWEAKTVDAPYHDIGTVVYRDTGADDAIAQYIESRRESQGQHMLWTDRNGTVLYDEPDPRYAAPQQEKAAKTITTEVNTTHDQRIKPAGPVPPDRDPADRDTGTTESTHSRANAQLPQDPGDSTTTRPISRRGRAPMGAITGDPATAGKSQSRMTMTTPQKTRTAAEPDAAEGPSEFEMTEQLEQDPGAQWRDLYLQPIIRAIRNRFDLPKGSVTLVGPKKKTPFGDDQLGFEITGHVRFEDFKPSVDEYGRAPYRFTCNVSPEGELLFPVALQGSPTE